MARLCGRLRHLLLELCVGFTANGEHDARKAAGTVSSVTWNRTKESERWILYEKEPSEWYAWSMRRFISTGGSRSG